MKRHVSYRLDELDHKVDESQRGAQLFMFCRQPKANFVDFSSVRPWHVANGFIIARITQHCYSSMDTCLSIGRTPQEQFLFHYVFPHVSQE